MIWIDKFKSAFEKIVSPVVESPVSEVLVEETESLFESSLSRLYSKYNNHAVGAITGFRGTRTRAENKSINSKLLAYLLSKGYSVTKVKGAYVENFGSDDAKEVGEESFFVANAKVNGDDKGQLEADLVNLGKMFDQDSILIVPYGGKGTLVGTSNRDNAFPSLGDRVEVGSAKFGGPVGQFYSRVNGRKFAFEEMVRIKEPETIAGKRAMIIMAESVEMGLNNLKQ
jgi:hypothetical protein